MLPDCCFHFVSLFRATNCCFTVSLFRAQTMLFHFGLFVLRNMGKNVGLSTLKVEFQKIKTLYDRLLRDRGSNLESTL